MARHSAGLPWTAAPDSCDNTDMEFPLQEELVLRYQAEPGSLAASLINEPARCRRGTSREPAQILPPELIMAIDVARSAAHSIHSSTLADVLERVLDKGLVIAGDIKIKLVDIELLTIQIRLVVASVDKARNGDGLVDLELGIPVQALHKLRVRRALAAERSNRKTRSTNHTTVRRHYFARHHPGYRPMNCALRRYQGLSEFSEESGLFPISAL